MNVGNSRFNSHINKRSGNWFLKKLTLPCLSIAPDCYGLRWVIKWYLRSWKIDEILKLPKKWLKKFVHAPYQKMNLKCLKCRESPWNRGSVIAKAHRVLHMWREITFNPWKSVHVFQAFLCSNTQIIKNTINNIFLEISIFW